MNGHKVLLVEDEPGVISVIQRGLGDLGFDLIVAIDGLSGLQMALASSFDAIVLDLMLPGMNGIEVCRQIRKHDAKVPVIMLTALNSTENIVNGLDTGADDYMPKPFKIAELAARLRTLIRRSKGSLAGLNLYITGNLEINFDSKSVTRNSRALSLTATEYRLLEFFIKNAGKTLSRIEILENVWNIDFNMGTNVVDVYVNYLRRKLDPEDTEHKLIHTVFGMGYLFKPCADANL